MRAGVGADGGGGLFGVDCIAGGLGVGIVVVGCLVGFGDGIVCPDGGLGSSVGFELGIRVLSQSLGPVLGILDRVANGTGAGVTVGISLAGRGVGGATTVSNHIGLVTAMSEGGGDGTGDISIIIGAGVGSDNGIELTNGDGIVGELWVSTGIPVTAGLGAVGGVWFEIRVGNVGVIEGFGGGCIRGELIVGIVDGSFIGAEVGTGGDIGFGV